MGPFVAEEYCVAGRALLYVRRARAGKKGEVSTARQSMQITQHTSALACGSRGSLVLILEEPGTTKKGEAAQGRSACGSSGTASGQARSNTRSKAVKQSSLCTCGCGMQGDSVTTLLYAR